MVTECYRCLVHKGFPATARHSVALSRVWWWAQNWAQLKCGRARCKAAFSTIVNPHPMPQQLQRNVFLVFVLLHPFSELNRMFVIRWGQTQLLHHFLERCRAVLPPGVHIRFAPMGVATFLGHWILDASIILQLALPEGFISGKPCHLSLRTSLVAVRRCPVTDCREQR